MSLKFKELRTMIAMITKSKVIELFFMSDNFCKFSVLNISVTDKFFLMASNDRFERNKVYTPKGMSQM